MKEVDVYEELKKSVYSSALTMFLSMVYTLIVGVMHVAGMDAVVVTMIGLMSVTVSSQIAMFQAIEAKDEYAFEPAREIMRRIGNDNNASDKEGEG